MFKRALIGIILNGLTLYAITYLLEDVTYGGGIPFFILGGAILGILNMIAKPILKTLSLPLVFLTGGLFLIVINTLMLWVAKTALDILAVRGIMLEVNGLITYFIAGFLLGVINWIEHLFIKNKGK